MKERFEHDSYNPSCFCRICQPALNAVYDRCDVLENALKTIDFYLDEFDCGACEAPPTADVSEVPGAVFNAIDTLRLKLAEERKKNAEAAKRIAELEAESSANAKACGEEMARREQLEKNWNAIAASNKELVQRALDSESKRVRLLEDLANIVRNHK